MSEHYLKEPTSCDKHGFRSWKQLCPYCKEDGKDDEILRLREGLGEALDLLNMLGITDRQMKRLKRYLEPDHTADHVTVADELPPEVLDAGMPPIDAAALIRAVVNIPTKLKGKPATPPPPPPKKYI